MAKELLTTPIPSTAQATQFELSTFCLDFVGNTVTVQITFYNFPGTRLQATVYTGSFADFGIDAQVESNLRTKIKNRLINLGAIN